MTGDEMIQPASTNNLEIIDDSQGVVLLVGNIS